MKKVYIGTASWNIPKQIKSFFPSDESQLKSYSKILNCVEINSSFYRDHKPETYKKWADSVGDNFRFSVKLSKYFTHTHKLKKTDHLQENLAGIKMLKDKLGVLIIQLPPSLEFEQSLVQNFFSKLRRHFDYGVVLEPRHKSWIDNKAFETMKEYKINKVLADPEPCLFPKNVRRYLEEIKYLRLHGTPEIYKSRYKMKTLQRISKLINKSDTETWCIFDNTTFGYATENALELLELLKK